MKILSNESLLFNIMSIENVKFMYPSLHFLWLLKNFLYMFSFRFSARIRVLDILVTLCYRNEIFWSPARCYLLRILRFWPAGIILTFDHRLRLKKNLSHKSLLINLSVPQANTIFCLCFVWCQGTVLSVFREICKYRRYFFGCSSSKLLAFEEF